MLELGRRLLPILENMVYQMSEALDELDMAEGRMVIGEYRVVDAQSRIAPQLLLVQEAKEEIE